MFHLIITILILFPPTGQPDQAAFEISLDEVAGLAEEKSPFYQLNTGEFEILELELQAGLQRRNPTLNYMLEHIGRGGHNETEQYLFLGKTFERPALYRSRERSASHRLDAAGSRLQLNQNQLITYLRRGYVNLQLLDRRMEATRRLIDEIEWFAGAARRWTQAGELSPLGRQLIELSRQSISKELTELTAVYQQKLSDWKLHMGIDQEENVILDTDLNHSAGLPDSLRMAAMIQQHPGLSEAEAGMMAAGESIITEQKRRIPEFELSAGYKRMNPDWNGFTLGISLPIPVLSRNQAAIRQRQSEHQQAGIIRDQLYQDLKSEWYRHWQLLTIYHSHLETVETGLLDIDELCRNIRSAFSQDALTLTEALNALELGLAGYSAYMVNLTGFYDVLAGLEYLTGLELLEQHTNL